GQLFGADFYYDADAVATGNSSATGAGLGGTGTWDLSLTNWWSAGAANDIGWNNGGFNTAIFWGSAGTVTLGEPVTARSLTFNPGGSTIAGSTPTLGASTNVITMNNATTAVISSTLAGSHGFALNGGVFGGQTASTLVYQGASGAALTGNVDVNNGMT